MGGTLTVKRMDTVLVPKGTEIECTRYPTAHSGSAPFNEWLAVSKRAQQVQVHDLVGDRVVWMLADGREYRSCPVSAVVPAGEA